MRKGIRNIVLVVGLAFFTSGRSSHSSGSSRPRSSRTATSIARSVSCRRRITIDHYTVLFETPFLTYFRNSLLVATATTVIAMVDRGPRRLRPDPALLPRPWLHGPGHDRHLPDSGLAPLHPALPDRQPTSLTDGAPRLVVIYLIFSVPFSTWLTISYFNTVPSELEDAALVDGATRLRALFTIFIPLALPALAVVALFTFTVAWNEFLFALLLIRRDSQKTVPVGLAEFVVGDIFRGVRLMAGSLLASLPPVLIYVAAQRWVVSGLAGGAIKG